MKQLVGRGPLFVVTTPKAHLSELASFEIDEYVTGWKATRRVGTLVESISLRAAVPESESELESMAPDSEVEWTVTIRCFPDRTWFGGPTAAGSTLVSAAVAFWVTYSSLESLPRKPSLHFASATLLLVATFGAMLALLYGAISAISKRLVARMEQRPTRAILARVDRLTSLASGIPQLGLAPRPAEGATP